MVQSRARLVRFPLLVLLALPVKADAGVPMLFVTWPGMLVALIPVIVIEAWIMKRRLKLAVGEALRLTGIANAASAIVGIPLAWLALAGLELVSTRGGTAF